MAARLVIVSEFVDATLNSTGYYWAKIVSGLAQEFPEIFVVCPRASYLRVAVRHGNVTYVPYRAPAFDKNKLISRLFGQLMQTIFAGFQIARVARRGDLIFSGTNPPSSILLVAILKKLRHAKWALLVHDMFPENLAAAGLVDKNGVLFRILKRCFNRAYRAADIMFSIGRDMSTLLFEKTGAQAQVVYIPNWVDSADVEVTSLATNRLWMQRGWQQKVTFQFFGNLGRVQGLSNVLSAIALVKTDRAAFMFIGSGAGSDDVDRFVRERSDVSIVHIPSLPFAENSVGLAACDIALVSLDVGMKGLAVPSKAYFSMAANKPLLIVADKDSELHRLWLEEKGIGWYCESGKPELLANLIDQICEREFSGYEGNPRNLVKRRFDYSAAIDSYALYIRAAWSRS